MLHAVVEGHLDGRLLRVLLAQLGHDISSMVVKDAGGSGFWKDAQRFNEAGRHMTVLGLADLEQAPCPVILLSRLKGGKAAGFKLRLAVRMLESWIMADREAFAGFLGVRTALVSPDPDAESHPKRKIVALARQSKKRMIREALVPNDSGAVVGPEYTPVMAGFVESGWNVLRARTNSPSLSRACNCWSTL